MNLAKQVGEGMIVPILPHLVLNSAPAEVDKGAEVNEGNPRVIQLSYTPAPPYSGYSRSRRGLLWHPRHISIIYRNYCRLLLHPRLLRRLRLTQKVEFSLPKCQRIGMIIPSQQQGSIF